MLTAESALGIMLLLLQREQTEAQQENLVFEN